MTDWTAARTNMVNGQVIVANITDRRLIASLSAAPRERFVPPRIEPLAYSDSELLLKEANSQSASRYLMPVAPFAKLVQEARIKPQDIVLDIACATGYSSSILARLANTVVALDCDEGLANIAGETLLDLGVSNVAVVTGPLHAGRPDAAPYDVIILEGSVEIIPPELVAQLREGGRLVGVVGQGLAGFGTVFTKSRSAFSGRRVFNAAVRPLPGFAAVKAFAF